MIRQISWCCAIALTAFSLLQSQEHYLEPFSLQPAYQTYLWGGDRIANKYNRSNLPPCVAESWELSDRPEGLSIIKNGSFKGKSLKILLEKLGTDLIGTGRNTDHVPLLIKIIDAQKSLSVQVHPNETMAALMGSEAKAESWYALSDGFVYAGFKRKVSPEEVVQAILTNSLETLLERIDMQKGDMIYIPGGTVHAIGNGSLILEVQQNSNTTYRLYDWGRIGTDGKPRPLHIEEGLLAIDWDNLFVQKEIPQLVEENASCRIEQLLKTPYFIIRKIVMDGKFVPLLNTESLLVFFCEEGEGNILTDGTSLSLKSGETVVIPAAAKELALTGTMTLIEVSLPKEAINNNSR